MAMAEQPAAAAQVDVQTIDASAWLRGNYIGVGSIDMQRLAQRRIYTYLMNFFVTDKSVRQAFDVIRSSGIVFEDVLKRIVVGIPEDVDKAEHIILWETTEDLTKYKAIIHTFGDVIDARSHQGITYYATKRENECIALLGHVLVLGSELKVKAVLDAYKSGYKGGVDNQALRNEVARTEKTHDAWVAFVVDESQRAMLARTDPVVDMTAEGRGALRLSDIHSGHLALDFAKGLHVDSAFLMSSQKAAEQTSSVVNALIANAKTDPDVKALGFDIFFPNIHFSSKERDVLMSISLDQSAFDQLIALVTQVVKSVPGQHGAAAPAPLPESSDK